MKRFILVVWGMMFAILGLFFLPPNAVAQLLEFYQLDFILEDDTTLNSYWGDVDLTFDGQDPILYFNLTVDTAWVIENIPVLSHEGTGVMQTMTYSFPISFVDPYPDTGIQITEISYAFQLTDTILTEKPQGMALEEAEVNPRWKKFDRGLAGARPLDFGQRDRLRGHFANGPKHSVGGNFPNQECDPGQCVPAAVSNSLQHLNNIHELGIDPESLSIAKMRTATNWDLKMVYDSTSGEWIFGFGCWYDHDSTRGPGEENAWWEDKRDYMAEHDLPFTTEMTIDYERVCEQISGSQVVEFCTKSHAAGVIGITPLGGDPGNEKYAVDVAHDTRQGVNEGTKTETIILNPWDSVISGSPGLFFGFQDYGWYFVIQCPDTSESDDCSYVPGDCNHNGTPLELSDVISMITYYRGVTNPSYTCACPPHGDLFPPTADPNGNCVPFELGDVVAEIAAYRGTGQVYGCVDCPPAG